MLATPFPNSRAAALLVPRGLKGRGLSLFLWFALIMRTGRAHNRQMRNLS